MYPILLFQLFICISLLILLLCFPGTAHVGADLGLSLFLEALFPYLLSYLILINWLLKLSAAYPLQGRLYYIKIYVLSAFGGFPTGASILANLVKQQELSVKEANLLLGICHAPSPLFIIGFVGQDLLQDPLFSWHYLLLIHGFSLILLSLLPLTSKRLAPIYYTASFTVSIRESAPVVLVVGSTIIFFSTIYAVIYDVISTIAPPFTLAFVASALELTNGLHALHLLFQGDTLRLLLVFLLTTQSLSIHLQVAVIAKQQALSLKLYAWIRLLYSVAIPLLYLLFFL